jgi:hypothetical protein
MHCDEVLLHIRLESENLAAAKNGVFAGGMPSKHANRDFLGHAAIVLSCTKTVATNGGGLWS